MKNVFVQLTVAGTNVGPFIIVPLPDATPTWGISKANLIIGETYSVPDNTNTIRIQSTGQCTNYIDLVIGEVSTTTTTTTSSPTTTTTTTSSGTTTTTTTAQVIYCNPDMSTSFQKNDCPDGPTYGDWVTYPMPAGTYCDPVYGVAIAQAQADIDANGQNYANTNGACQAIPPTTTTTTTSTTSSTTTTTTTDPGTTTTTTTTTADPGTTTTTTTTDPGTTTTTTTTADPGTTTTTTTTQTPPAGCYTFLLTNETVTPTVVNYIDCLGVSSQITVYEFQTKDVCAASVTPDPNINITNTGDCTTTTTTTTADPGTTTTTTTQAPHAHLMVTVTGQGTGNASITEVLINGTSYVGAGNIIIADTPWSGFPGLYVGSSSFDVNPADQGSNVPVSISWTCSNLAPSPGGSVALTVNGGVSSPSCSYTGAETSGTCTGTTTFTAGDGLVITANLDNTI
jgi:hypothetical protein